MPDDVKDPRRSHYIFKILPAGAEPAYQIAHPGEKDHTNVDRAAWISTFEEALAKTIVHSSFAASRADFSSGRPSKRIASQPKSAFLACPRSEGMHIRLALVEALNGLICSTTSCRVSSPAMASLLSINAALKNCASRSAAPPESICATINQRPRIGAWD